MRRNIALSLCTVLLLTGCAKEIVYPDEVPDYTDNSSGTTAPLIEHPTFTENKLKDYGVVLTPFSQKHEAEELTTNQELVKNEGSGFSGKGYVVLEKDASLSVSFESSTNQHYKIEVSLFGNGTVIGLYGGEMEYGGFYADSSERFKTYTLEPVYLRAGDNTLTFKVLRGNAEFDYIRIESTPVMDSTKYEVSAEPINYNASKKTRQTKEYLANIYGDRTLTAQHCTTNTNVEIEAIYAVTGRYPAIRVGDLVNYSRCYGGTDKENNKELELARDWASYGGLVMLDWTWYSPMPTGGSHYYAASTAFKIDNVVSSLDLATADMEYLEAITEAGQLKEEALQLVRDIDDMAANLRYLADENVTVLWRPLKEASLGWYWWGNGSADSYKYVWRLMVDRFHKYHKLDNLLWVWTGESAEYYPGDQYVDIIGQDCYNMTETSNAPRMEQARTFGRNNMMVALTECGLAPNPDVLSCDNAMWLFFGLYKGDYLVGDNGMHASAFNIKQNLNYIYHHELTLALDEVIVFDET